MKPRDQFGLDALLGRWPAQDPQEKGGPSWEERAEKIVAAAAALKEQGSPEVMTALLAAPRLEPEPGEEKAESFGFDHGASARDQSAPPPGLVHAWGSGSPSASSTPNPVVLGGLQKMSSSEPKRPSLKELAARASIAGAGKASVTPLPTAARASTPAGTATSTPLPATVTPIARAKAAKGSDPGRETEDSGILRLGDIQANEAAKAEAAALAAEAALAAQRAENQRAAAAPVAAAKPAVAASKGNSTGMWAGVAIAVIGIAAAFAVYKSKQTDLRPPKMEAQAPEPPQGVPMRAEGPVLKAAPDDEPKAVASAAPSPAAADAPKPDEAKGGSDPAPAPTAVAVSDPQPSKAAEKPLVGSKVGTLDEEMKKAVGANDLPAAPQDDGSKPASGGAGNLPEQPSQGNAQAGIRAVLPAAKACVAGATEPTSASVTFSSSGSVQSVSVGGWAAANGKGGCVKSALQGAHVAPFAKPSFTVPVTVRP